MDARFRHKIKKGCHFSLRVSTLTHAINQTFLTCRVLLNANEDLYVFRIASLYPTIEKSQNCEIDTNFFNFIQWWKQASKFKSSLKNGMF